MKDILKVLKYQFTGKKVFFSIPFYFVAIAVWYILITDFFGFVSLFWAIVCAIFVTVLPIMYYYHSKFELQNHK